MIKSLREMMAVTKLLTIYFEESNYTINVEKN